MGSEYGCNNVSPRTFTEVPALYGKEMTSVFSGGLIYEYSEEPNNYGLVNLNDNGTVSLLVDYDNLRTQYDSLDIGLLEKANATATSLSPSSLELCSWVRWVLASTCSCDLVQQEWLQVSIVAPYAGSSFLSTFGKHGIVRFTSMDILVYGFAGRSH